MSFEELMWSFRTQGEQPLCYFTPKSGREKCHFCGMPHMSYRMVDTDKSVCDYGMENLKFTTEQELRFDARGDNDTGTEQG